MVRITKVKAGVYQVNKVIINLTNLSTNELKSLGNFINAEYQDPNIKKQSTYAN